MAFEAESVARNWAMGVYVQNFSTGYQVNILTRASWESIHMLTHAPIYAMSRGAKASLCAGVCG